MVILCLLEAEVESFTSPSKLFNHLSQGIFGNMPILREGIDGIEVIWGDPKIGSMANMFKE